MTVEDWPDGRTDIEHRFLARLEPRQAAGFALDVWERPDFVAVTHCVFDPEHAGIIRTLRADFNGVGLTCGNDPTHQIVGSLDPKDPDWFGPDLHTPEECADAAFAWLESQANRAIDRHEWAEGKGRWYQWILADSGTPLLMYTVGGARGLSGRLDRTADRVVRIN